MLQKRKEEKFSGPGRTIRENILLASIKRDKRQKRATGSWRVKSLDLMNQGGHPREKSSILNRGTMACLDRRQVDEIKDINGEEQVGKCSENEGQER